MAIPAPFSLPKSCLIPVLDEWLADISSSKVDETVAAMLEQAGGGDAEPPDVRRARKVAQEAQTKLDRYPEAIEKGMDRLFTSNAHERPKPSWRPQGR
jgi:hypothetical protein